LQGARDIDRVTDNIDEPRIRKDVADRWQVQHVQWRLLDHAQGLATRGSELLDERRERLQRGWWQPRVQATPKGW
jgi:hypothetical protein